MRVLITGAGGQLGRALSAAVPAGVTAEPLAREDLDITYAPSVEKVITDFAPAVVINAAAFTRVDDAQIEQEAATRVNVGGPTVLAAACRRIGAWLIHVSTDYVFSGEQARPYGVHEHANPLNVYGRTKAEGEAAVKRELPGQSTIVRTSWLYGSDGSNFLTRMLERMRHQAEITVVSDQIGAPTSVTGLASVLWAFSRRRLPGVFHWCDSGVASWYDFAVAIQEESFAIGILASTPNIIPVATGDYPTTAPRPRCSLLDKRDTERALSIRALHWRVALRETLQELNPCPQTVPTA